MRKKGWKNLEQLFAENKKELLNDKKSLNRIDEKVEEKIQSAYEKKGRN
ncbi:FbpB family small basic protein (plasmid) [Bacillus mycoides]|nr:FbpB family small basic protein [Bacillus mycoides]